MNTEDLQLTLDDFHGWRVDALRSYLSVRGLAGSQNKQELVALAFAAHTMKMPILPTTLDIENSKVSSYKALLQVDGEIIPDPLTLFDKWADEEQGMKHWPPTFITDVTKFLLSYENAERAQTHLNQYKIGKAFEYYASNWMKEVFYHSISPTSKFCILKAQCTPSQSLNASKHSVWICVEKSTGSIKSAYCSCTSGLGQTCNHVAGLLFRVEAANKLGMTASTSSKCFWNIPVDRKLQPCLLKDMKFVKSTHGKEASRPLVEKSKTSFRVMPSTDLREDEVRLALSSSLQNIIPNACIYKGLPNTVTSTMVNMEKEEMVLNVDNYTMAALIENDVGHITDTEVAELNSITTGQAKNPNWVKLRKERITSSNFYAVHTKMESEKLGRKSSGDVSSLLMNLMGYKTLNPNIRSLKYGRETEPVAKDVFKRLYHKKHKNVHFEECGIFIDTDHPYLGASPDLLVSCSCCGEGVVEFKCPLVPKCSVCQSFCTCKAPAWMKLKPKLSLKTLSGYYGQVQGQMAITGRDWCEFFVYTCNGNFSERIYFDSNFYLDMLQNLTTFFVKYVLPEIRERVIQTGLKGHENEEETMEVEEAENEGDIFFCPECRLQIQNQVANARDRSICCDSCLLWFHFSCVGMRNCDLKSLSKWHCRKCTSKNTEQ